MYLKYWDLAVSVVYREGNVRCYNLTNLLLAVARWKP
jgi:hypothetical protein